MKKRCIVFMLFGAALFFGCGGGSDSSSGSGEATAAGNGTAPTIEDAVLSVDILEPGDTVVFWVQATDPDLDMQLLYTTPYYSDNEEPLRPSSVVNLSDQTSETVIYYGLALTMEETPGDRRMEVQIRDDAGNLSNVFTIYYTVQWPN